MVKVILGLLFIGLSIFQVVWYFRGRPVFINNSIWTLSLLVILLLVLYFKELVSGNFLTIGAVGMLLYVITVVSVAILERKKKIEDHQ